MDTVGVPIMGGGTRAMSPEGSGSRTSPPDVPTPDMEQNQLQVAAGQEGLSPHLLQGAAEHRPV